MTPAQAEKRLVEATTEYSSARYARDQAEEEVERARRNVLAAQDDLRQAQWQSVPCPACGAPAGRRCTLERDKTVQEKDPGILHTARVVAANRKGAVHA